MAKQKYYTNITYNKLNFIKAVFEALQISYTYYLYFYNTYNVEFTATTKQLKIIKTILEG